MNACWLLPPPSAAQERRNFLHDGIGSLLSRRTRAHDSSTGRLDNVTYTAGVQLINQKRNFAQLFITSGPPEMLGCPLKLQATLDSISVYKRG